MSNRKFINKKFVKDYITKSLVSCRIESNKTISGKYHHNSTYEKAKSILTYGILSLNEMNKKGIVNLDVDKINLLSDTTSHINGIDGISLSVVGLDDLYAGEYEYNPFSSNYIDYIISDNIDARRVTEHYGNEFISYHSISLSEIISLDFRIIQYINDRINLRNLDENSIYSNIIYKYNILLSLAKKIKEENLNIQIREMSSYPFHLDVDKTSELPTLKLSSN